VAFSINHPLLEKPRTPHKPRDCFQTRGFLVKQKKSLEKIGEEQCTTLSSQFGISIMETKTENKNRRNLKTTQTTEIAAFGEMALPHRIVSNTNQAETPSA